MRKLFYLAITVLFFIQFGFAKEPSFLQYFYSVKNILPETKNIALFIPQSIFEAQEIKIRRAAKQMGIKAKVFLISDTRSIGKSMKELKDVDILLVYNAPVLVKKNSRLFVLSKCKDKKITIISSSRDYMDSGAFIYIGKDENKKTKIVLNLKQTDYLAARFTDESTKKMGIAQLIR